MKIIVENVRSLAAKHTVTLRPLTFLTGENSSGKTSFLGAFDAMRSGGGFPFQLDLASEPYELGTFDTVATHKGGRYGRAKSFSLGLSDTHRQLGPSTITATYIRETTGRTHISRLEAEIDAGRMSATFDGGNYSADFTILAQGRPPEPYKLKGSLPPVVNKNPFWDHPFFMKLYKTVNNSEHLDHLMRLWSAAFVLRPDCVSISPIRTRPKRTYDTASESYSSEGSHIPYVLARMFDLRSEPDKAKLDALIAFGNDAGLFRNLKVKKLGTDSDPIQVLIKIAGPHLNLKDVGYGVSQCLPVVVQSIIENKHRWILIQQPEVHLHPRAQAALGTFFAKLTSKLDRHFVIETHSDYIIDRVRQEIAMGGLKHSDAAVLFFDRNENDTRIHEILFDSSGNFVNVPDAYRQFFLEEQLALFERTAE
jgi:hypothetical protein